METKFKIGDKVRAWGLEGTVIRPYSDTPDVLVRFDIGYTGYFDGEGKGEKWHKEPSLVLVSRPKKKVTKALEVWGCRYVNGGLASNDVYQTKLEAEYRITGSAYVTPIKLTGTYEIEVDDNE